LQKQNQYIHSAEKIISKQKLYFIFILEFGLESNIVNLHPLPSPSPYFILEGKKNQNKIQ